jgi:hypothetical protein
MPAQESEQLLRSAPYFPVADVEQSVAHYESVLGVRRDYVGGSPPEFAILNRDRLSIMLRRVPNPALVCPIRWRSSPCAIATDTCWDSGRSWPARRAQARANSSATD